MTDRRPLGTGPVCVGAEANTELPVPRGQLAAERLPTTKAAAEAKRRPPAGRRSLGAGPAAPGR
ncbi:hypothetical protein GCM10010250_67510 [Streptomyces althioticus]|uniref:hypothetical protein n=1 Tax=Streptomyces althioticus TaxID=83380 RepID=UPI00187489DE|nr:hypothetical protein GCM10010250_67510 [Streptomyces althioticus]